MRIQFYDQFVQTTTQNHTWKINLRTPNIISKIIYFSFRLNEEQVYFCLSLKWIPWELNFDNVHTPLFKDDKENRKHWKHWVFNGKTINPFLKRKNQKRIEKNRKLAYQKEIGHGYELVIPKKSFAPEYIPKPQFYPQDKVIFLENENQIEDILKNKPQKEFKVLAGTVTEAEFLNNDLSDPEVTCFGWWTYTIHGGGDVWYTEIDEENIISLLNKPNYQNKHIHELVS